MLPAASRRFPLRSHPIPLQRNQGSISESERHRSILPLCAFGLPFFSRLPRSDSSVTADHMKSGKSTAARATPANVTRPAVGAPRTTSKRKVALFVGYDGAPYHGIQRNPGVETVVDVLERALYEAGAISDENFGNLEKVNFSVAARTDKGVSCAGNLIAIKARFAKDTADEGLALRKMTDDVNALLPAHVRVFQTSRVTSSFSARVCCDERSYEYLLPLDSVLPGGSISGFGQILSKFAGSHFFHNYTVGKEHSIPPLPQARRLIRSIACDPVPFVFERESSTSEWVRVRILGQSFMLHQIRKMMAMALLSHLGRIPIDAIEKSFSKTLMVNCPPAPAVGLFLDFCAFGSYNDRYHDHLKTPVSFEPLREERERFKKDVIFPSIARRALDGNDMDIFFQTIDRHAPSFEVMCSEG